LLEQRYIIDNVFFLNGKKAIEDNDQYSQNEITLLKNGIEDAYNRYEQYLKESSYQLKLKNVVLNYHQKCTNEFNFDEESLKMDNCIEQSKIILSNKLKDLSSNMPTTRVDLRQKQPLLLKELMKEFDMICSESEFWMVRNNFLERCLKQILKVYIQRINEKLDEYLIDAYKDYFKILRPKIKEKIKDIPFKNNDIFNSGIVFKSKFPDYIFFHNYIGLWFKSNCIAEVLSCILSTVNNKIDLLLDIVKKKLQRYNDRIIGTNYYIQEIKRIFG